MVSFEGRRVARKSNLLAGARISARRPARPRPAFRRSHRPIQPGPAPTQRERRRLRFCRAAWPVPAHAAAPSILRSCLASSGASGVAFDFAELPGQFQRTRRAFDFAELPGSSGARGASHGMRTLWRWANGSAMLRARVRGPASCSSLRRAGRSRFTRLFRSQVSARRSEASQASPHSARRAATGSVPAARKAGSSAAARPTSATAAPASSMVNGSSGATP